MTKYHLLTQLFCIISNEEKMTVSFEERKATGEERKATAFFLFFSIAIFLRYEFLRFSLVSLCVCYI